METRRDSETQAAEAALNLLFRRALLMELSPKARLRVIKMVGMAIRPDTVVPIAGHAAHLATLQRARDRLREQLPFLLEPEPRIKRISAIARRRARRCRAVP